MENDINVIRMELQGLITDLSMARTGAEARPLILSIFSRLNDLLSSSDYDYYKNSDEVEEKGQYGEAIDKLVAFVSTLSEYSKETENYVLELEMLRSDMLDIIDKVPTKKQTVRMALSDSEDEILVDEYEVKLELEFSASSTW